MANQIHHPLYPCFRNMKARCFNQNHPKYRLYGARGITVCDRWRNDFQAFVADMGDRPEGHSLDRIDNDGDYTPENCRWATVHQQVNNRGKYKQITNKGEKHHKAKLSDEDVATMRALRGVVPQATVAVMFGINRRTAERIMAGHHR